MSTNKQTPLSQPMSVMRNTLGKEQVQQNLGGSISEEALREYCDKNYHQILPIIAEKVHQEKVQQEKLKDKGSNLEMLEEGLKVLSRGATVPCHKNKEVQKEERCSKGWKRVYFIGSETRRRMCPHIRDIQGTSHIIVAIEIQKVATEVITPRKQKLLPRNIITKEYPRKERKHCQKVTAAQ
ncbi:hypothetical protein Tco_1150454 [Tanacetum coccineum]